MAASDVIPCKWPLPVQLCGCMSLRMRMPRITYAVAMADTLCLSARATAAAAAAAAGGRRAQRCRAAGGNRQGWARVGL